ncbi:hypothetical protein [Streptomyces klenkii]|uniref:hypothetical protein n=1 Tax=Streptomyces klenkii TaxID=1420899 RepID=UPI00343902F1
MPKRHPAPASGNRPTDASPAPDQHRLTLSCTAALIAFPALGTVLATAGVPIVDIAPLLASCAAVGLATVLLAGSGRRLAVFVASIVLRITQ